MARKERNTAILVHDLMIKIKHFHYVTCSALLESLVRELQFGRFSMWVGSCCYNSVAMADVVCFPMLVSRQQKAGDNKQDILAVTIRRRRS